MIKHKRKEGALFYELQRNHVFDEIRIFYIIKFVKKLPLSNEKLSYYIISMEINIIYDF